MTYAQFFQTARGDDQAPYAYQCRLACGPSSDPARPETLVGGTPCHSQLINIPTGLGKTAAVVLAWLWNRTAVPSFNSGSPFPWPRRLVYCLPMRTLVEQTAEAVTEWLTALSKENPDNQELKWLVEHSPIILMGGEDGGSEWDIHPERPAILIGTQDMLLSRALNRGYGMSRYRWPMHFGLLNNDCLWIHDETQLMGVGMETSVQLAGFRSRFGTLASCAHWWMSATLNSARLVTPEAPPPPDEFRLTKQEEALPAVKQRFTAVKRLQAAATQFNEDASKHAGALAAEIKAAHVPNTLTLAIVNTVDRAQELFRALRKVAGDSPVTLLHSRFRPHERRDLVRRALQTTGDHLVISTQVIEAGADVSARTLFTELAPWSSLVQRFGRCHRHGEMAESGADIRWLNVPDEESAPYDAEELAKSRAVLEKLTDVSLTSLAVVPAPVVVEPPRHIIRPKDLRELFDTTPDIAGADLDVSRFIRERDDTDCAVFWRTGDPALAQDGPTRDELCPVPVARLREFAEKHIKTKVWTWDALDCEWVHPERIVAGREYWLDPSLGGYDPAIGFDRKSRTPVLPVPVSGSTKQDAHDDDLGTTAGVAETLEAHTAAVVRHTEMLCSDLALPSPLAQALRLAGVWHDVGKAHFAFQDAIKKANPDLAADSIWAKSGVRKRLDFGDRSRFRHELASALAFRASIAEELANAALVAFLIAAHHGKVRLSLRSLPDEEGDTKTPDRFFARGIWDGDELPPLVVDGQRHDALKLDLSVMQMGWGGKDQPSWLEACLELRDSASLGPFRLAYLESLLRAADIRASEEIGGKTEPQTITP